VFATQNVFTDVRHDTAQLAYFAGEKASALDDQLSELADDRRVPSGLHDQSSLG